jgi:hypothetical protein
MTAMKKNITTKPTLSPAPATKSVAAKSAAKKKSGTTPKVLPAAANPPAPVAKLAPTATVAKTVVKTIPVQPVAPKPVNTTIMARVDVGFGNALYLRGEGAGLTWDAGVPMQCIEDDLWRLVLGESARGYVFKFLVNDLTWSIGPDNTAANGASVTLTPEF